MDTLPLDRCVKQAGDFLPESPEHEISSFAGRLIQLAQQPGPYLAAFDNAPVEASATQPRSHGLVATQISYWFEDRRASLSGIHCFTAYSVFWRWLEVDFQSGRPPGDPVFEGAYAYMLDIDEFPESAVIESAVRQADVRSSTGLCNLLRLLGGLASSGGFSLQSGLPRIRAKLHQRMRTENFDAALRELQLCEDKEGRRTRRNK